MSKTKELYHDVIESEMCNKKNKLLKSVDLEVWHNLKLIALKKNVSLATALKIVVEFFILKNFKN